MKRGAKVNSLWNAWFCPHAPKSQVPSREIIKSFCYVQWDQHLRAPPWARGIICHSGFKHAYTFFSPPPSAFVPLFREQQMFRDARGQGRGSGAPHRVLGIFPFPSCLSPPLFSTWLLQWLLWECNLTMPPAMIVWIGVWQSIMVHPGEFENGPWVMKFKTCE